MRKVAPFLLGLLFTLVLLSGCGSSGFVNEQYSFEERPDSFSVAVHPVVRTGSLSVYTDTTLASMFDTTAYGTVPPQEFRKIQKDNPEVSEQVNKLRKYEYSKSELESGASATSVIGENEFREIRNAFRSKYLLLPKRFNVSQLPYRTFGDATYRLYDLEKGVLVYQRSDKLNVNRGGREGAIFISVFLMAKYNSQFESLVLER
jgi:hypothetical protein